LKNHQLTSFYEVSEVFFKTISEEQIRHYISTYAPMDKAGAYGIQEWIGLVAVEKINGSYSNIVGLPTQRLYEELQKLVD
jgi:septum formation protein